MMTAPVAFTGIFTAAHDKQFVRDDIREVMTRYGSYTHRPWGRNDHPEVADLLEVLSVTDVLLTAWSSPRLPLELLEQPTRRLKYICNLTGSIQHWVPREYLEAGVIVTNWGNGPMWYLAEGNLALILALTREMGRLHKHMLEQPQWTYPFSAPNPTLRRKTVGFVGYGAIAGVLRGMLRLFECPCLVYDPYAEELPDDVTRIDSLEELFSAADVITIQCGLNPGTVGMVNRTLLDRLKPNAIFVNTARGKIVVQQDLADFLRDRPDVGAGLDVFETEPLPTDSPLLQLDNAICSPHSISGGGEDAWAEASRFAADNLEAFCTGKPLQAVITPRKYDLIT